VIEVQHSVPHPRVGEAVLFPFDDHTIPFSAGLRLHLVPGKSPGVKPPIVLGKGQPGEPDDQVVRFYGTVIPVGDELRMWYLGGGTRHQQGALRACYAVSADGVTWHKPKLGLVEHNGDRDNNLVDLLGGRRLLVGPADPARSRRPRP
jgi:hypothetical protein